MTRLPLALLFLPLLAAAPPVERDWAEALRRDARALHDDVAANHPGPVDRLNPGFARLNDRGLALALRRAARVRDYSGYWFAMGAYVASFDDGHMQISAAGTPPDVPYRWPGFLTGFAGDGAQRVMSRADDAPVPMGARLVACDGRRADRLAAELVGAFQGRWQLASQRNRYGGTLFVDQANPFVTMPARCTFEVEGKPREVAIAWRPLPLPELTRQMADTSQRVRPSIGARTLADGTRWYQLSSFNGSPSSEAGKTLPGLIEGMATERAALAAAPAIVLDLRGNGGGSSEWSYRIATVLWGEAAVARAVRSDTYAEWRASPANLAEMEKSWADLSSAPQPAEVSGWFARTIVGIKGALAAGRPLWRDGSEGDASPAAPATAAAPMPLRGPVYFVTDPGCGSACLDAADLWRALGAIQVGRETGADTLYMDIRQDVLPSGASEVAVPMKVYRGRQRGANQPLRPVHAYPGDLRDTAALERWVAALPERHG